ncbi:MAG: prepilin-type N-terminal cleavage/methylation domain-containing protein [Parcubacteria group bacterium]|jgi:prepilin-type N-terminal cleavage/methylation domain-containing protein
MREKFLKQGEYSQKGLTLVEMLIAVFIFLLMMNGVVMLIKYIYRNYGFSMEQGISVNNVQKSLKTMIGDIRGLRRADSGAYAIKSADDFDFVFYSDVDGDGVTEQVHYFLENDSIKKGVSEPSGTPPVYPSSDQVESVLAEHVVNTTSQPLFSYYNEDYPADLVNNPLAVPVSQISQIRMVKTDVRYNLDPNRAPDNIRLESFVALRNLKDNW